LYQKNNPAYLDKYRKGTVRTSKCIQNPRSNGETNYSIEEEIKERIAGGNRAYHVFKKLFTSK
jgi:hypothetical protein